MVPQSLVKKFEMFKDKYASSYSEQAWKYIEEHFFTDIHNDEVPDLLMQVYAELGVFPSGAMFYRKHFKLLKSLFPLDGNIVEVGGGRIPALANLIAGEQRKIGKGTITVYDPLLVELEPKYPNMTLLKEYFYRDTDISNADLIAGVMTCGATDIILDNAIPNNKDFYLAMCGCVHTTDYFMGFYSTTPEMYQTQIITKAQTLLKAYGGELGVTKLDDSPYNFPILYRKK